jgi:hypothetical protein
MVMSGNKIVKSVSFNIMNEKDKVCLERINDLNFSGYVKRLIEQDIREQKVVDMEESGNKSKSGPIRYKSKCYSKLAYFPFAWLYR